MSFWEKLFGKRRIEITDVQYAPQIANSAIGFGDVVRIKEAPETIAIGLANAQGTCFGQSVPSSSGVDMIGTSENDFALNVSVEGKGEYWLADQLVEKVRHEPATIEVGGRKFITDHDGKWRP
ncbi:MAG TPA: hypothetical protein VFN49_00150, partial [Candidatus Aquilonibacter sp.]|nr:hypothetical protein [Candidatus Aquilonibacter sp.]